MFLVRFLIGNLWSTALICVMFGLKRILQSRASLRFQYDCWYVLVISMLLPFFPGRLWQECSQLATNSQQTMSTYNITANTAANTNYMQWTADTTQLIVEDTRGVQIEFGVLAVWVIGVLVMIGFYWCGSYRLRQIRCFAEVPGHDVQALFDKCCQKLGIHQYVEIRQSRFVTAPVSFGLKKPFVVLPNQKMSDLSHDELEHIIMHELTHIRHGDLITNYLFCTMQVLYWFNPMVWLAFRQMRRDREAYCDWTVLTELSDENARIQYGKTILHFAARCKTRFFTANGLCQNKAHLKYRLKRIVGYQRDTKWRKIVGRCLLSILALLCSFQIPALALCAENNEDYYTPSTSRLMSQGDWQDLFSGINGCAVVYDLDASQYTVYNESEITHRVPPCSTFKIYSALNALEQGIITPENNMLSWDGTEREFDVWNQDHNLYSAMQKSVNWYFQSIDQAAGVEQLSAFYKSIHYGNSVIGNDTTNYWNGSSLKISALEQVELLIKLYTNSWGFNNENIEAVKNAMRLSVSDNTVLYGKSGTGKIGNVDVAGWFVGFEEQAGNTYFFAVYLCDKEGADGTAAMQIATSILNSMNISTSSLAS